MSEEDRKSTTTTISSRVVSIEEAFEVAAHKARAVVESKPGQWVTYTDQGKWVTAEDPWAPTWSGGFFTGILWILAERTNDPWWREQAEHYSNLLEPRKLDRSTHDIGFIFDHSWGRWHDLAPSERTRDVLVQAGRTMAARMQPGGGYLSTWVDPGSTFIDVMMNVGIILRAADLSGDEGLREVAHTHACTSLRHLVRGDGSTVHEGWFDTTTGEFLRAATHQGSRPDTTWARGQTWAIYGFTTAYLGTKDPDLLDAARRTADYYIRRTPEDGIPPNDWYDDNPEQTRESSAAAIAAAGMLRLATALADQPLAAEKYRTYARGIMATLCTAEYVSADLPEWEGILRHATYHYRNQLGVNESVMWGDYFFVEALDLLDRLEPGPRPDSAAADSAVASGSDGVHDV